MLKVWVLSLFFSASNGNYVDKYYFATREDCVKATAWYKSNTGYTPLRHATCYPSLSPK